MLGTTSAEEASQKGNNQSTGMLTSSGNMGELGHVIHPQAEIVSIMGP